MVKYLQMIKEHKAGASSIVMPVNLVPTIGLIYVGADSIMLGSIQ